MNNVDTLKRAAAERALEAVSSGMIVGLGSGSTAIWVTRLIAERLQDGRLTNILGIPCSSMIEAEARRLSVPLTTLEEHPHVDITIDGADEVDPQLDLIKGGGGALMREKIVAQASAYEIIVVDHSKLSPILGTKWHVPVEVIPFGYGSQQHYLEELGARAVVRHRADGTVFHTDQGNIILDCAFGVINDPVSLAEKLKRRTGIAEHGLFIGIANEVIVAGTDGIRQIKRGQPF
jgi:ribose 5-phosphate isomerase A